ncbi:MAG TPA: PAS domain S-box protein [Trichocoleus sp.]|jgi:PAS domain S-box-containing protein
MSQLRQAIEQVFVGNSEMARLMRSHDWSQTPLGSVETWSQSLRTSINICLSSRSPILLWWGTDFVMFYNDACRSLLGAKHPKSMGQRGQDCWIEGWDVIRATLQGVLLTGEVTSSENQQLLLDRHGYLEECYFTFFYSPIADETGGTGGVFTAVTETTRQVIGERRLQTLRNLAANTAKAKTLEEAYKVAIAALDGNTGCIPFALLYRTESDNQAHLVGVTGLEAGTAASPIVVDLSQAQAWPFEQVRATKQPQRVENLRTRFGESFDKNGTTIANDALILPLTQTGGRQRVIGFLVLGISSKLAFDPDYQSFFDLVAGSVETAIVNVEAYEAKHRRAEALTELDRAETTSSNVSHEFRTLRPEAARATQNAETILSSISDGVYTFDRDWRYAYVNDRLCQMAGKSREELLGHCIWEVFPEAVETDVYVQFRKATREQMPLQFEALYSPWNRWFEHRLYPAPDGLTVFSAEVTTRKQADLVLVEQKRLLEFIALGQSLDECLSALCDSVSRLNPRARACILLADAHRLTFPRSITPDFPPSFGQGLKDAPINELCIGTCGEAVYSGQPATCADIANDDRWSQKWRDLCTAHGILACHSVPVLDVENQPLGSLMLCFDEPRMPNDWEYQIATFGAQIASIMLERDRANVALQQSEEQLRLAAEAASLGLWHWDVQSDTLTWTDQCKALFGLPTNTEMSYQVFLNAIHPDDRQRVQNMRPVLEDGQLERHEHEYRTLWPDGTVRWLMARGSAIYDADGNPTSSMGVIFDITERKQAEIALHVKSAELRHVTETAGIGLTRCSRDLRYLSANPAYAQLAGMTVEEIVDRPIVEVMGESAFEVIRPYVDRVLQGERVDYEAQVPFAAGGIRDLYIVYTPDKDSHGNIIGWIASVVDISDRKRIEEELRKSEQQLRSAIEVARFSPYEWNPVTGELVWDARLKAMWGLAPDAEVNLAVHNAGLHPEDREYVEQQAAKAIDPNGDGIFEAEFRVIGIEDGVERWISGRGQTFFDAERRPVYYVGAAQDISDRKRAEAALRESEERFRVLADCAPCLIWLNGADGGCEFVNQAYLDFFGKTLEELQGFGWQVDLHPDDAEEYVSAYLKAFRERNPFQAKVRVRRADGQYRWLDCYAAPRFSNSGALLGYVGTSFDITDRRQTEEALRESEERLRLAMEAAQMGSWDLDIRTGKLLWSEQYFKVLGYEPVATGEVSYEMWSSRVHPDDRDLVLQRWQQSRLEQQLYRAEYRVIRADNGQIAWVASLGSFTYDETGEPIRALGVVFDITDRKQTDAALQESLAILNTVNEVTPTLIYIKDRQRRLQMVNPATARLLGKSEAELIGKTEVDYLRLEEAEQIAENDCRVMESGQVILFEELVVVPEGNRIFLSAKAPYRDEQGNIIGLIGVSTDITDRKQAELALRESEALARARAEELEALMEVVPVAIWLAHDPDCHQVTVNRAAYNLMRAELGDPTTATPAEGIYPFKFKLQIKGQDVPAEELSLQKAGRTGQEVVQEAELVFEDGVVHYMYGRAVPLRDGAGNVRGVIGAYVDISDRKQAEAEREQLLAREQSAREEAERANRIKDEFLAVLSHELRSPLNPILGWSRLLLNGNLDEVRMRQALTTIERNAKLQAELIEDLLDVSRILQGKLSLTVSSVNLASTIKAAIETVRLAAEAKSIAIETNLDFNVGLVSGDATRLQQVVWNLLSNAVKFTPEGGHVIVQLEQVERQARITVSDTGKGIVPDFLPYVFDYFRQADSATTRKFGGLGLGLAIVRHLVELHGGTIQADSPGEGLGATFTVHLPLMQVLPKIEPCSQLPQQSLTLQGIHVLVVDDDTDSRDFIEFLLRQSGAMVMTAASAEEALTALMQFQPDVLLSDIGMPEMDGYMLMQRVRVLLPEQGGQIPAIALTAYAGEFDQRQALSVGFQRHVPKPVEPEKLVEVIVSLLNRAG